MKCASQVPVAYGPYGLFVTLLLATPPVHATLVDLAAHGRGTEGTHAANLLKNLLEDVHADGKIMDGIGPEAAGLAEAALAALSGQKSEVGGQDLVALGGPGGLLGKGLGNFSASVLGFQRSINQTHRETKERLVNLTRGVHSTCKKHLSPDNNHKTRFVTAVGHHRQCRKNQETATKCVETSLQLKTAKEEACDNSDILTQEPARCDGNQKTYERWVTDNLVAYGELAKAFKKADKLCNETIKNRRNFHKQNSCEDPSTLRSRCDDDLDSVEKAACAWSNTEFSCGDFETCYNAKENKFNQSVKVARAEEVTLKGQWRLTQRLRCLLGAMTPGGAVDKDVLGKCVAISLHSTDHLNHTYPKFPTAQACTREKVGPGSEKYNRTVYSDLPDNITVRKPSIFACQKVPDGRLQTCQPESQKLLVGSATSIQTCNRDFQGCSRFNSEKLSSRLAMFGGDFFLSMNLAGVVKKCVFSSGSCGDMELTAGNYATIIPKTQTSFYISMNQNQIKECFVDHTNDCINHLRATRPFNSFAIDFQTDDFLLARDKSVEKCPQNGMPCTKLEIRPQEPWSIGSVFVDNDGDYLISEYDHKWTGQAKGSYSYTRVVKCPRSSGKDCQVVGGSKTLTGRVVTVIPQKDHYLVTTEAMGATSGGLWTCPASSSPDHKCEKMKEGAWLNFFGMALYCKP